MESSILHGLNPAQYEAVIHDSGPLLVIAGAGSGKTRVLTHRIARLIDTYGVSPFGILAITFTNKAALEMRERVEALVGPVAQKMWVSTFHSACVRILRRESKSIGFPSNFTIYDSADSRRLISYIQKEMRLNTSRFSTKGVQAAISAAKNEGLSTAEFQRRAETEFDEKVGEVFVEYQRRLKAAGAMDFDDLLGHTVALFKKNPGVLEHWQRRFEHVLVDEYQDTNIVQNELVMLLGQRHRNVCVVGDADQSIYGFRKADIRNILNFEQAFEDATVVVLDQNYRSSQNILDAANAVISYNTGRKAKDLWTESGSGEKIFRYDAQDQNDEARWLVNEFVRLSGYHHFGYEEMAILYRTNAMSRVLEEYLMRVGLPYRVIGGTRFYDRKEVKDAIAYLHATLNPSDEVSIKRVLNTPRRGIGDASIAKLDTWAKQHGLSFFEALENAAQADVKGKALKGIAGFLALLDAAQDQIEQGPAAMLAFLLAESGYRESLEAEGTIESEGRIENLDELAGSSAEFSDVSEFLEQVALVSDTDDLGQGSASVTLMTMHAAKGLEFPVVAIVGLEDGLFPHVRSLDDSEALEEERRLAYVGITRAEQRLYLCCARERHIFGNSQYNPPSRFFEEIPEALIDRNGLTEDPGSLHASTYNSGGYSNSWSRSSRQRRERMSETSKKAPVFGGPKIFSQKKKRGSSKSAEKLDIKTGDRILHKSWGEGTVVELEGEADKALALVNFASVGKKRLLLAWAPIEKI